MEYLLSGFAVALQPGNLLYCFLGVLLGTFIGVLPGIGPLTAVSMLLPITFHLDPTAGLIMLAGVYYGAEYGGSTASILLNLPGTAAHAVTCLDGHPMAKQGRAGVALFITTITSFVGGSLGILVLMFLTPAVVAFALSFGPAEFFAMMVLGLIAAATIGQGSPLKGLIMVVIGMLLATIGVDPNSGTVRFNFGSIYLYEGFHIVIIAMGLFGVSEVIASILQKRDAAASAWVSLRSMIPTKEDMRRSVMPTLRGSAVGGLFGGLPGTGPSIASFLSYAFEKRISKDPSKFGTGIVEGISAPEASNNAAVQVAFIPTLALGIPGSATMAVMLGALMVHGISPGPQLVAEHPDLFWGVVASFWIGNVLLLLLNIPLIGVWVSLLKIPYKILYPSILVLICVGVYSIRYSAFDVYLVCGLGVLGYAMRLARFEPAPLLVGFILGPMIEQNFRRAMLIFGGDLMPFLQRPISGSLLAISFLIIVLIIFTNIRKLRSYIWQRKIH